MRIAYFDCFSGVSGNMILGAFLELGLDFAYLKSQLRKLPLSGYAINTKKVKKMNLVATELEVSLTSAGCQRRTLREIKNIIHKGKFNKRIEGLSFRIFETLANAEAMVHGYRRDSVHFHEIGDTDSIVDIVGAAIALDRFRLDKIYSSAINVGSGTVKTRHGIFPVPAPATVILLKGVTSYSDIQGYELATPTGVAILKMVSEKYCHLPLMKIDRIGCGAGTFDIPTRPNLLRVFLGTSNEMEGIDKDNVLIIETNIDDMNLVGTEMIMERIFKAGALDVYFEPIYMKKTRMGIKLSVIAEKIFLQSVLKVIFQETTTFGVRTYEVARYKLGRVIKTIKSQHGSIRVKTGRLNNRLVSASPEYKDCREIAEKNNIPFRSVYEHAQSLANKKFTSKI